MKADVFTLAVVIFVIGILVSGFDLTTLFADKPVPVAALQQGVSSK